ncbi:MAG: PQQ-binding-like beta-propeller repeat protein [Bacillota bacterium]|nr:PQQ-binding-like beta-propeller repeat protein [Bacillota bacterium]
MLFRLLRAKIHAVIALALLLSVVFGANPRRVAAHRDENHLGAFKFIFICDSHVGYGPGNRNLEKAASLIRTLSLSLVIAGGDLTERGLPGEYGLFSESLKDTKLLYAVPGNHDTRWKGKPEFRSLFGAGYRSFDYGGYHFVLLDTSLEGQPDAVLSRAQLAWLEQDLMWVLPDTPVLVFSHHPLGQGAVENEEAALSMLRRRMVACYVSGHGHTESVTALDGVPSLYDAGILEGSMLLFDVKGGTVAVKSVALDTGATRPLLSVTGAAFPEPLLVRASVQGAEIGVRVNARPGERISIKIGGQQRVDAGQGSTYTEVLAEGLEPGTHAIKVEARQDVWLLRSGSTQVTIEGGQAWPVWRNDLGESVLWPVASDGGTAYIAGERGFLYAVDLASGRITWKANLGAAPSGGPVIANNLVLCPTARGYVIALEKQSGTFAWATAGLEMPYGTPAAAAGKVFIPCGQTVVAVDAATGKRLWTYDTGAQTATAITADGGRVFVGAYDGRLLCLSEGGTLLWQQVVETSFYYAPVFSAPTVGGGLVVVSTPLYTKGTGHTLHAFSILDGAKAWSLNAGTTLSGVLPVEIGFLAATAVGKTVLIQQGKVTADGVMPRYYGGVLCAGRGLARIAGEQAAYGVDSRGYVFRASWAVDRPEIQSIYSLGNNCYTSPVAVGRDIVVADVAGHVMRLRFQTGTSSGR